MTPASDHHTYVTDAAALDSVLGRFRAEPLVAVDTEAASFHKYVDRVYLIQLSSRVETAVLDPLALPDVSGVGALLADPSKETVFHDADYDLRILDRDYGFRARRLFDTRIAAQLLGDPSIGLAALLEKYLGVRLSKAHQRADWSQRPLPPEMLAYAAADTHHLPALRDALRAGLQACGRLGWAEEEFVRLEAVRWSGGEADPADGYLRLKGVGKLTPRQLAALREVYRWREETAKALDRALFRVMSNEALLGISQRLPTSPAELARVTELPASLARRYGPALLDTVARARALPDSALPRLARAPRTAGRRDAAAAARLDRLKAARNAAAERLRLDPGVLCAKGTLELIARANPKDRAGLAAIGELRRWQIQVLGDAFLKALAS